MTKGALGNGWSHGYDIHITPASHGEPGMGLRQPVDAAAMTAALYVGYDLLKTQDTITAWLAASLTAKWAIDRVIDNAMVVRAGKKSMEFIKLADGTYAAPPGITTQLIKNGDNTFSLVERFGTRIDFNSSKKASRVVDADGNILSLTYNGSGNLQTVADAFGRTLTLGYDTNLRVNRVTDSTGRYVTYGYNGSNDLVTFTDPENKSCENRDRIIFGTAEHGWRRTHQSRGIPGRHRSHPGRYRRRRSLRRGGDSGRNRSP
jgi:YD repeat-containing protein